MTIFEINVFLEGNVIKLKVIKVISPKFESALGNSIN